MRDLREREFAVHAILSRLSIDDELCEMEISVKRDGVIYPRVKSTGFGSRERSENLLTCLENMTDVTFRARYFYCRVVCIVKYPVCESWRLLTITAVTSRHRIAV